MKTIRSIAVCGAGTMGSGIAQIAAQSGFAVIQFDVNESMLGKSKELIQKNLQFLQHKGKISETEALYVFNKILFTSNIQNCKADIIIEAIVEKKEAKANLFEQLISINTPDTIYATNTSSISVNEIANEISRHEPRNGDVVKNFAGLHFFNPAPLMKLVEVIKTDKTSAQTIETLIQLSKQLGKTPVVCKDAPGFIVNRVARHYYLEAMKLIELNLATVENIDAVMEASGFKMGPFKLMDLIGMDINFSVSNIVWNDLGQPERLKPSIIQQQKVEQNKLGRKTGEGFYKYS